MARCSTASRAELLGAVADEMFVKLHAPLETAALAGAPLASRVAMILDHYHRIYASALYRAVVSASLDPRSGVRRQLQRRVNENQDLMSRNWQEAFADLGIADQDLHATRRLAMSLVRGYAIVPASGGGYWERDVAEVQALIVGRLERYGRKRPGRPTV